MTTQCDNQQRHGTKSTSSQPQRDTQRTPNKTRLITDYFTPKTRQTHDNTEQNDNTDRQSKRTQDKTLKLNILTHNIQTLENAQRIHELDRICNSTEQHIVAVQGTCWDATNSWDCTNYRVYHCGKPKGVQHKHEGVMIMMHHALAKHKTERIYHVAPGRVIAVRLSDRHTDITVISVYIPTEESNSSAPCWHALDKFTRSLPKRTTLIVAGDMNAHIRMTEQTHNWHAHAQIRNDGRQVLTNDNGKRMCEYLEQNDLFIANTTIKGQQWTKQSPDGCSHSMIDYILIQAKQKANIRASIGADYHNFAGVRKEGTSIDHIAVSMSLRIPYPWKKQMPRTMPRWDAKQLSKLEDTWEESRKNQQVKHPTQVDETLLAQAQLIRDTIQNKLRMRYHDELTIDDMADTLQHIGIETLEEIIPYTKKVTVKQSYIDDELWSKIENRQTMWRQIMTLSNDIRSKARPINVRNVFQAFVFFCDLA